LEENGKGLVAANEYGKALQILLEDADPDEANHAADLYGKIQRLSPNNPALAQYDPTKFTRAPQPAAPSPLETAMKMQEAAPPPVPPPAPVVQAPLAAAPSPAPPPAPAALAGQKPAKRAKLLDDAPMVDDDLTEVLTPKERPKPKPAPQPAAPLPPPMVDDDLTDLLSRPIPKVTKVPKIEVPPPSAEEKPSLAKTLFGFFQSSPAPAPPPAEAPPAEAPPAEAPQAEAPPSPPLAAPVEAAAAAPPQWKPWQSETEEAPAPVAEAPPAAPPAEPQAAEWKPWQPSESTAPAAHAGAPPAGKGDFFVVDSKKGTGGSAPSLGTAMPKIPARGRTSAPPMPLRAVGRRAGGLGQAMRKLTMAAVGLGIVAGLLLGTLAIGCLILEKSPSDAFRNFSGAPPLSSQDPRRNAYALLLGFDADAGRDPMAEGYERAQVPVSAKSIQCAWEDTSSPMRFPAEAAAVETWWLVPDPVGQFQREAARIQGWTAGSPVLMGRYRQWLGMEFEDAGYGKFAVPNCALVVMAHRLHVAEGFGQGLARGIDGLEKDLSAWRKVLAQARTLPVKQMALTIVNDDLTLLAGVFSRPELTPDTVSELAQLTKPLEQVERSLRWPMQNALTMDAKLFGTSALFDAVRNPSPLINVLAHLPLPKQRVLNAHADYFEALI
jgi:hypothetical protein